MIMNFQILVNQKKLSFLIKVKNYQNYCSIMRIKTLKKLCLMILRAHGIINTIIVKIKIKKKITITLIMIKIQKMEVQIQEISVYQHLK